MVSNSILPLLRRNCKGQIRNFTQNSRKTNLKIRNFNCMHERMNKMHDENEIWVPEEQARYLMQCAERKGLTTAKALSDAAGVDPAMLSRCRNGSMKNPGLLPFVRLYRSAGASMDRAFHIDSPDTPARCELSNAQGKLEEAHTANDDLQNELDTAHVLLRERENALKDARQITQQRGVLITALVVILIFLLLVIVGVIVYDRMNPDVGWFRDEAAYFSASDGVYSRL